ncbi:hypothetical protein WJX84_003831 [Apatococcus fuscideae]|uniref:Phosphotyrosine protein phosphatase I domain-containing protein n=1 Tax=Apatococcus fuscideae TaxID=2026836 RepID=A0AAW1SR58_9CHLO
MPSRVQASNPAVSLQLGRCQSDTAFRKSAHSSKSHRAVGIVPRAQDKAAEQHVPEHKVLFVCLGNICRSPSAEAVFKDVVKRAGLLSSFHIDSCGTGGGNENWFTKDGWSYHMGYPADDRMISHAAKRNIELTSKSRPLVAQDMIDYDYIIAMDADNVAQIQLAADHWIVNMPESVPRDYRKKVKLMTSFLRSPKYKDKYDEVPDPYFGGEKGFELVLDLLDDACEGLLADIQPRGSKPLVA